MSIQDTQFVITVDQALIEQIDLLNKENIVLTERNAELTHLVEKMSKKLEDQQTKIFVLNLLAKHNANVYAEMVANRNLVDDARRALRNLLASM